jgi:predicted dehydrogenase
MPSVCLVGCGRWGRLILRDLVALGARVEVAAPSAVSREAALAAGAACAFSSPSEIPGTVDGFIVATPTATHAEVVESLLSYGVPIFVEKPLTPSVEAARRLVRLAGERIFVMDKWRYHPGIEALRDQARSGALGDILAVRSFRLGWGNPHRDVDAVWILMPHDLAIAYEILGYLPAVRAAYTSLRGNAGSDLVAVLGAREECAVVAEISALHPISRRAVTVIGTEGSAQLGDS